MLNLNSYTECIEYLYGLQRFGIKLGLSNIISLLKSLGNPHNKFKSIHIAGSNGKGSTGAIIASILQEHGYKVGVYTSPHLVDYTERIKINNKVIPQEKVVELTNTLIRIIDKTPDFAEAHPTYFEITTAQAFAYFAENEVDFAVIETGMGGRLDATNVLNPVLSIITSISLEHTDMLGDTISKIAYEKGGIIKNNVPVVTGILPVDAVNLISETCRDKNSQLYKYGDDYTCTIKSTGICGSCFDYNSNDIVYNDLQLTLIGDHQPLNAGMAITAVNILNELNLINLNKDNLFKGVKTAQWPGRMEIVSKNPYILLDGAHNPDAAKILSENIKKLFPDKKTIFIIGILKDKNRDEILKHLCSAADNVILTNIAFERASSAEDLYKIALKYSDNIKILPNIKESILHAGHIAGADDLICISGSLYLVGEAISILKNQ